jgi:hypothetical protein
MTHDFDADIVDMIARRMKNTGETQEEAVAHFRSFIIDLSARPKEETGE